MKTLILILILIIACSCVVLHPQYVFYKTYSSTDSSIVITDIYKQFDKYQVEQIPLSSWMVNEMTTDTINLVQRKLRHEPGKDKQYLFIFSKFTYPSKTYYEFKVRYLGKDK